MKKIILPLFAILLLVACDKESTSELMSEEDNYENDTASTRSNKRDICHKGKIKNVSVNAIASHQGHGDAVDMDGDGYFDIDNPCSETDCDDTDAAVYPGATEVCDGIDNNCDASVDEDVTTTFYADADGDTFGDPNSTIEACSPPVGYVSDNTDCDDTTYNLANFCGCVEDELEVEVDPDGVENSGDEYTLYVYPEDNNTSFVIYAPTFGFIGATDELDGDANTDAIVDYHGSGVNYAAGLCASLKTDDCDWYLPARLELEAIYQQLGPIGSNDMSNGKYWHSTEPPGDFFGAFYVNFVNGNERIDSKFTGGISCRCVRK